MTNSLIPYVDHAVITPGFFLPEWISRAGPDAEQRFVEFFAATIRNPGTRQAYLRAVLRFIDWCEHRGVDLPRLAPIVVAAHIEQLQQEVSAPTVKLHLAAIRQFCDHLVVTHVLPVNPAASVRGPKHVVTVGKTPVLAPEETRLLLDSIDCRTLVGLRDRALIAVMVFTFARVSAVVGLDLADYYQQGKRGWLRFHEKGGKRHEVPCHHKVEEYLDAYFTAADIPGGGKEPIFRACGPDRKLTAKRLQRRDALKMVKRRAVAVGLPATIGCHSFRATGITTYLENGGSLERAAQIAGHASMRTTKLYDRRQDSISLGEIERIVI